MPTRRFNPALPLAFAVAIALHAVVLPLVLMGGEGGEGLSHDVFKVLRVDGPDSAVAGADVELDVLLSYEGPVPEAAATFASVWLSRDRELDVTDGADDLLYETQFRSPFGADGGEAVVMLPAHLPEGADGPYQLIVVFRPFSKELLGAGSDWSNNTRATPLYIDGIARPELQIAHAQLPEQAIAGGTAFFDYTVQNRGPGYASTPDGQGGWRDAVYLSADTTLDPRDLPLRDFMRRSPLAPGDTYAHQRVTLDLPRITPGNYYLILAADADQVLDQPSFTAGYYTQPIELLDTNKPDLAIASIVSPGIAALNEPFSVQWTAANLGSVDADPPRHDAVYLSKDDTLDASDTLLTTQRTDLPLPAQQRAAQPAVSVTIPNEPMYTPGDWHLIVVADDGGAIDEGPFEYNNHFAVPITLIAERLEDDEPDLGEPDNAPRLTVAWIEHERIERHMARLSETIQPAIQNLVDPDPNAPLVHEPRPPAPPAIALQAGGDPNDPTQPVNPNEQNSARPQPPAPDAPDTNTAPRPRDPNAQPPERVEGLDGNGDDLPMPREGEDRPTPRDADNNPQRPDTADRDDDPRNPGERRVESDADPDAPDTESDTDSETPAPRDRETDSTNPDDNDSDQPSEVMDDSAGETPNDNDPSEEPSETDGQGDADNDQDYAPETPDPAEQDSDRPEGEPVPPSNPSEEEQTTRAPRDDAEADPTDNQPDPLRLEEGNVLVGQGVRVNTSRIRRGSTTSRLTATPRDTLVRIVFNSQGQVVEAEVLGEGTGYEDWDSRLLEALYRWTAQGPDIEAADPHYVLQLEYKFGLLNRRAE
ncbi:MAG: hypothetical protein ACIAXF_13820 [Phycisphaerales bacterium JB063]